MSSIWMAFFLDLLAGDPQWFPHPVRLIGKYIQGFEGLIRRRRLGSTGLRICGIILTVTTVGLAYLAVGAILQGCALVHLRLYQAVNIIFLWTCLAPRCLQQEAARIAETLRKGDLPLARRQLALIVGRDTDRLDESGVVRAVVETVAENTCDGVIAPLLYMFIGGAPLAMAYKAVNTLDSMVGYRKEFYQDFGWCAAKTDDVMNYLPARLTAALLGLVAWLLKLDYKNCVRIIRRDRRNHTSPNSAYPEAAVAGALGVQLGGVNYYFGNPVTKPVIGDALGPLRLEKISLTNRMMYGASVIWLALGSGIDLLIRGWGR